MAYRPTSPYFNSAEESLQFIRNAQKAGFWPYMMIAALLDHNVELAKSLEKEGNKKEAKMYRKRAAVLRKYQLI